jgi:hypothetical protein
VESLEGDKKAIFHQIPVFFFEESWTKAIRPRDGIIIHGKKGKLNLIHREGADEGGRLEGV